MSLPVFLLKGKSAKILRCLKVNTVGGRIVTMKRFVLGKTGIEAVRFGFGGIPIQRVDERKAVEIVLYALQKGMDFIDTSRAYTTSESRIGKALKETDKKVCVATKSFNRSAAGILKDIDTSLEQLGLEYIDLYQCHAVSNQEE
jgi:aryl-alcohol dehydrogenase-like predicted oxidoreductase